MPQPVFILPTLFLLIAAIVCRNGPLLAVNTATALFFLVTLCGFHWVLRAQPPGQHRLRVMTYNIEGWHPGTDGVVSAIQRINPDVVCLEEADDSRAIPGHPPHSFQHSLTGYQIVSAGEIILASRLPIRSRHLSPLPPGPGSRPAVEVVADCGGAPVTIVAVHLLPNQFDQHLSPPTTLRSYCRDFAAQRNAQDTSLLRILAAIKTPLLVCGDFNAQPQTRSCRRLTAVYPDTFDQAGFGFGDTIPSQFPLMRIDHILIAHGTSVQRAWVPAIGGSDHNPLVAEVSY